MIRVVFSQKGSLCIVLGFVFSQLERSNPWIGQVQNLLKPDNYFCHTKLVELIPIAHNYEQQQQFWSEFARIISQWFFERVGSAQLEVWQEPVS